MKTRLVNRLERWIEMRPLKGIISLLLLFFFFPQNSGGILSFVCNEA